MIFPGQPKLTLIIFFVVLWDEWRLEPVTEPREFPTWLPCRRVSVNASGYGGTNSHAILENFQHRDLSLRGYKSVRKGNFPKMPDRPQVLVFSAHDNTTLIRNVKSYSEVSNTPELIDVAYTLAERRSIFPIRAFAICRQESINANVLDALQTIRNSVKPPTIAFAFTGTGSNLLAITIHAYLLDRSRGAVAKDGFSSF
jgi:acyl transferase domain-containing protein